MATHGRARGSVRLAVVSGLTTWLALLAWSGFVERSGTYLNASAIGIVLLVAVGAAARRARFPAVAVVAAQLLAAMLYANLLWGSAPWPSPASVQATMSTVASAVSAAQEYMAPVPSDVTPVAPLLVGGALLCHLLVDLAAVTLGRVPMAGLPLLMIHTLPVSLLDRPVSWVVFVVSALGFLLMLVVQEADRVSRWGRSPDPGTRRRALAGPRQTFVVGAAATGLAVALPLAIPTLDLAVFAGPGAGSGDREVRITNPMTDLQRDLVRGPDVQLLRVRGPRTAPSYVRISVLTAFSGAAWTPGRRDLPRENAATGEFPPPVGLAPNVPRITQDWELQGMPGFDSTWLPTSLNVDRVDAGEEWRFDEDVLDVHAARDDITAAGFHYTLTSVQPRLDARRMADAGAPPSELEEDFTELPDDLPDLIGALATGVTQGRESDYEKAVALQRWFRTGGGFNYTTAVDPGNGGNLLEEFLTVRAGYCEQFSAAMAVMARELGIPARVAVGFLQPDQIADRTWEFTAHDLHAWPELYFEDAGWVRFEPTPAARATGVPDYTTQALGAAPAPIAPTGPTQSQSADAPTRPTEGAPAASGENPDDESGGLATSLRFWGGGLLLGLLLLALTPRAVRRGRTARRWHTAAAGSLAAAAEQAWAELRDLAVDHGIAWPAGRSPRVVGARLVKQFAAPPSRTTPPRPATGRLENVEAAHALDRLVRAVEQGRYAASPQVPDVDELRGLVERCGEAMHGGLTRQARWQATWLPKSVLSLQHVSLPRATLTRVRSDQDVVDHVG